MALDNVLARFHSESACDFTLRVYQWAQPTLSCGFNQKAHVRVDIEACSRLGVAVVRRPTGGRELLHDRDLSFSITGRKSQSDSFSQSFLQAGSSVILGGLRSIGIGAMIVPRAKKPGEMAKGPCLAATSQYEIAWDGKKIVPMAQRIFEGSILVHGSIQIRQNTVSTASLLLSHEKEIWQKRIDAIAVDLERITGRLVDLKELKAGLKQSFEQVFKGRAEDSGLTDFELTLATSEIEKWKIG